MLEIKNLCFNVDSDDGRKEILNNVSLTIPDNRFVVITGPNGGGKSTLAKLIMGVERPTSGQIIWNGADITNLGITERAKLGVGFAFQQPVRFKGLTVHDLLTFATNKESLSLDKACEYLSMVGLCAADYINRELNSSLSGGELKRIEIAMLLARSPMLSIFDEPEAGIDLWSFENLIEVFRTIRAETKGSILIISHQERILDIADEIVIISGGQVSKHGSRDEMLPELLYRPCACPARKEVRL